MANELRETPYGRFSADFCVDKLSNLCDPNAGIQTGPFGSQLHQEDYVQIGTPIITVEHLDENRILHANTPKVSDVDRDRLSRYQLSKGDIVFSRVGSVDRRALVREKEEGWLFSGRCLRVRPNPAKIDSGYLSYFFGLSAFKQHVRSIAVGATMPSLNTSLLSEIAVPYPPNIKEQRAIAHILGTLDDKIELNRRQNETLEAMARALFRDWFVDFGPVRAKMEGRWQRGQSLPGLPAHLYDLFPDKLVDSELGEIPEGWSVEELSGQLEVLETGRRPKGGVGGINEGVPSVGAESIIGIGQFEFGKTKYVSEEFFAAMRSGHAESMDVMLYKDGGKPGDFRPRVSMFGRGFPFDRYAINEHVFRMRSKSLGQAFLYLQISHERILFDLRNRGGKAAIPGINQSDVKTLFLVVPAKEVLHAFDKAALPMMNGILDRAVESRSLAKLRDTLLPKLISGEVRVSNAERIVGAVA